MSPDENNFESPQGPESKKAQERNLIDRLKRMLAKAKPSAFQKKTVHSPLDPSSPQPISIDAPQESGRPAWIKWAVIGGVVLAAFFMIKGCWAKKKASLEDLVNQPMQAKEEIVSVKAYKVGRYNYEDPFNALGTIKGAVEFKLSFEIPGVISSINYREGERYEEGALLISLKQDDILLRLKRAQAELNKSETQVHINEDKVKEHEKLFAMGAIPKTTLDKVKLEADSAKYEAESARLEAKAHEAMLEKSNLYAPSAGMIGQLNVEEGETVTPNTLLGSHIMTEYVFAEFGVGERDVNKLALGQKARVFVDAYADKTFEGVIENIAPVVAGTSRTATARVRIENPEGLLLPGMFARIRILLYSKKNALVVPTDAVQGSEEEQFVYAVKLDEPPAGAEETPANPQEKQKGKDPEPAAPKKFQEGIVEKRPISIGYKRDDYSQVDAGISEGELIAVTGLERLEDAKKVRLVEVQEAEL